MHVCVCVCVCACVCVCKGISLCVCVCLRIKQAHYISEEDPRHTHNLKPQGAFGDLTQTEQIFRINKLQYTNDDS